MKKMTMTFIVLFFISSILCAGNIYFSGKTEGNPNTIEIYKGSLKAFAFFPNYVTAQHLFLIQANSSNAICSLVLSSELLALQVLDILRDNTFMAFVCNALEDPKNSQVNADSFSVHYVKP